MTISLDFSTPGKPYTRIQRVVIDYPATATAHIEVTHQQHVPLVDGTHQPLGAQSTFSFDVLPQEMSNGFRIVHPQTGQDLGATMTNVQLMTGIFSAIAAHL